MEVIEVVVVVAGAGLMVEVLVEAALMERVEELVE